MEKFSDILNSIKDRFTNPLVFSFLISWVFINWKIVLALFWYDNSQIKAEGYNTIYSFIQAQLDTNNTVIYPAIFALSYTFLIPLLGNSIKAFYSWTTKWGNDWNLKISKGGKVGIESYLKLRDHYDKRTKVLEEVISNEGVTREEFEFLKTENLETKSENIELKNRETELRRFIADQFDVQILNGYWLTKYTDSSGEYSGEQEIFIDGGQVSVVKSFGDREIRFNLSHFHFDPVSKKVFFVKEGVNGQDKSITVSELIFEREDFLTGRENRSIRVEYRKK